MTGAPPRAASFAGGRLHEHTLYTAVLQAVHALLMQAVLLERAAAIREVDVTLVTLPSRTPDHVHRGL